MKAKSTLCVFFVALLFAGCASDPEAHTTQTPKELRHLGNHHFKITTESAQAQHAFDRGLTLAYAFSYYAAEQEFRRALQADPECAMAWWGVALVNGPHINSPAVPPDHAATAWQALTQARSLAGHTSAVEQALIGALSQRYDQPQPEDRRSLDEAYATAMREVWRAYPDNADVGTLFAEAAMDLHPWDLWQADGPQPWTPEILTTLERAIQLDPKHPGANHLYIHALEASPQPEKGVPAANRLRKLVPDASHLVHMPAHIYARVGRWEDAAQANRDAMKADALYREAYPRPGFYNLYMAHNAHFLAFAAMMQGRSEEALRTARQMVGGVPNQFIKEYPPVADGFLIFESEVLMRFGRWEEILAQPTPRLGLPFSRSLWHFTRTSALTALNRTNEAAAEKAAFEQAVAAVPPEWTFGNNSATNLLRIATRVLDGEMAAQRGQWDAAIESLRQAAQIEDTLRYDEPPDWIQPVRHTLGAVLLRAGQAREAETVYREDLQRYPENGWSLMGLRDALRQQGKNSEAQVVDRRFRKAWRQADVRPSSTCYCQERR